MQRVKLGLLCLTWLCFAGIVSAQTELDPAANTGIATIDNYSGSALLDGTYFDLRHVVGDGVGWQNSYSQLGLFTPFWLNDDAFIAPNERVTVTNSTQTGFNVGLVGRQYIHGWDRIIGAYGYYDNDQDSRNFRYSQFTVGAETLGFWDARINGYFISGNSNNFISNLNMGGNPYYFGNSIGFLGHTLRDEALGGGDGEFGLPVSPKTPWLRGYGGLYAYHTAQDSNVVGFRGRMEASVSTDLTLGVMVTQDALFGTNVNGTIDFKFSGFRATQYFPSLTTRQRMLNPVQRNWRIATDTYVDNVNVAAINPNTGNPYFIVHVDNSAPAGGNGTIEHPFNTLQNGANPAATDIILVHRGIATSAANAVNGSVVLSNNERLLGDGVQSNIQLAGHFGQTTIFNNYILPGTSNTGILPYVTNGNPALNGGNIVTLMNNNEVAGLNLVNAAGSGITNTAAGSRNFYLHDLEISGNAGKGISLSGASGVGIINKVNMGVADHANPLGLGNNANGGIQISTAAPGLDLMMSNIYMNANPAGNQAFGINLAANAGSLNANLSNVTTSGNVIGMQLSETSQQLNVQLDTVSVKNNTGPGIQVTGTGGAINLFGNDVAAVGNKGDNLQIGTQLAPIMTSTVGATFTNSSFSNSVNGSGIVFSQSGGVGTLNLTPSTLNGPGDTVANNGLNGLAIYASNGALMNANVQNGNFFNNGLDAFHNEANGGSTINLMVDPTNASSSGRDGLYFALGQDSQLNASFTNNNLNNSGRSAVYGTLTNGAAANIFFDQTTGANSGANGVFINATNAIANLEFDHGTFANSGTTVGGSSAINIQSDASRINLMTNMTMANNIKPNGLAGNQAYGLTLNLQNSSVFAGNVYNGSLSDSLVDAINANVASNSTGNLSLINVDASGSGLDGIAAKVDNAQLTLTSRNTQPNGDGINDSGRDGVNFNVTNAGSFTAAFDNGFGINNSGRNGILGVVNGVGSVANLSLTNNSGVNSSQQSGLTFNVNGGQLNLTALSSSFSNNGLGGTVGSGVLGTLNNGGIATLNFVNTAVNNNLDNGIFVTAQNGSSIQTAFSLGSIANNGIGTLTPHHNDGIRLEADASGFNTLHVFNNTLIQGNGDNGISLVGTNGAKFQAVLDTISVMNNGVASPAFSGTRAGLNLVNETNSQTALSVRGSTFGNDFPFGTQFEGINSVTNSGGLLTASVISTNLSNNSVDALNANVTSGGKATYNLLNVTGDNSGATGALLTVASGGQLNVNASVGTSFSQSGGSGLLAQVDGTSSVANLGLTTIQLNNNGEVFGGAGFQGVVTGGGTLNTVLSGANVLNNANQGISLTVVNPNSLANVEVDGTTVDFNGFEGLAVSVANQGVLNYRSVGSTYSNNGTAGTFDGVNVSVIGDGPANSAIARMLFLGGAADSNTGNGFALDAENGATLTTSLSSLSASNNLGGVGVATTANGANTEFDLLMSGVNTFTGNANGAVGPLDFNGINQAVVVLTGSYDDSTGDGIEASFTDVNNALFALVGPGTVNNSAGNGVNVSMTNVTRGSVLMQNVSAIDNSGQDGVLINMNNVAAGSINMFGATEIKGAGARGIDINLTNGTQLVSNNPLGQIQITALTPIDNLSTPLNGQLPAPVTANLNAFGIVADTALILSSQFVSNTAAEGISLNIQDSTIQANQGLLLGNSVTGAAADGILITANNSSAVGLSLIANGSSSNTGNGVNIVGNNASLENMTITGGGGTLANVGLDLTIEGFTNNGGLGAWNIINTSSTPGENITGFSLDLSTSTTNAIFNTVAGASVPFTPFGGTDTVVGLQTVNGTTVPPYPMNLVPDFSQLLTMSYNQFVPGQHFQWDIDTDLTPGGDESTTGAELIGSTITVNFTGGASLAGSLVALPGFPDGSHFVASSGNSQVAAVSQNGLDGVRFSLNNTDLSGLKMANNTISGNGTTAGNGIEFTGTGGAVANSNLNNITLSGNQVTQNSGDGVRLVDPQTTNSTIQMNVSDNNISQNGGTGVNLSMVAGQQDLHASFAGNNLSQNAAGPGVNVHLADNHNFTGGFDGNNISSNGTQGVNFNMGTNGVVTSNFTNNTINGNTGDGINVALKTGGHFESAAFTGNTIGTSALHNGGLGVRLTVPDQASFNWNLGDSTAAANSISGNTGAGVGIDMSGSGTGNLNVQNTTFSNTLAGTDPNFTGQGLSIRMTNNAELDHVRIGTLNAVNSVATNDVTFASNAAAGMSVFATGNAKIDDMLITNVNAQNNTGDGISFLRQGQPTFTNITVQNSQLLTNANGLHIVATNALLTDTYTINNNNIASNTADGVLLDARFDAQIVANMDSNTIRSNAGDGIHVIEQKNADTDNRLVSGLWTLNTITNNQGNGIDIAANNQITIGNSTTSIDNVISNNGLNGILIVGQGTQSPIPTPTTIIQGNVIDSNGQNGVSVTQNGADQSNNVIIDTNEINSNGTNGVQLLARGGANLNASIDNTTIRFNGNDGVQFNSSGGQTFVGNTASLTIGTNDPAGVLIADNGGRGVNILNQNDGNASIDIENSAILRNGLEGVYAVNTASGTQAQDTTSNLVSDGNIFDNSQMKFVMNNNSLLDNGHSATGANFSDVTGLYLRIGTNGASTSATDPGGFASNASSVNSVSTASLTGRGGVLALVSNNIFGGNAGHDVSFESFKSTVDPAITAGDWTDGNDADPTNDVFRIDSYQSDPLARLDLRFTSNVGQDADVTRSGTNGSQVAAYNTDEPIFKSRIGTDPNTASPGGPFTSETRLRNATRLASRSGGFSAPTTPPFSPFLYPGVGSSTFRVSTDSDFNNAGNANTNNFAATPSTFNSAQFLGILNGELPFDWTTNLAP